MILIGVDQGTTGTRTVAFDERLEPVAEAYRRVAVTHPQPGWIAKDAREVIRSVERDGGRGGGRRRRRVGWPRSASTTRARRWWRGTPATRRAAGGRGRVGLPALAAGRRAAARRTARPIERRSGLPLDPYFSSTKIRWLIENVRRCRRADDAVSARSTRTSRCASATARAPIPPPPRARSCRRWRARALGTPSSAASSASTRRSLPAIGAVDRRPRHALRLPLRAALVDQTAALAGPRLPRAGHGQGHVRHRHLRAPERGRRAAARSRGRAAGGGLGARGATTYALDGGVFSAGTVIEWLRDGLGVRRPAETEALARSVPDTAGVAFLPALAGLGAPWWRSDARGVFAGLTAGATRAHLVRAALDALCFRVRDVVDAMSATAGRRRRCASTAA